MRNRELNFEFMDELQAKRKSELAIATAPTKKVEPALAKKVWNPLNLDLNASTQSIANPKAKRSREVFIYPLKVGSRPRLIRIGST